MNNLDWEDGQIIISRKIMNGKNIIKVNGETISASMLRELAAFLIDIHGQHDNESLLKPSRHLDMLDEYGGTEITRLKKEIGLKYREYRQTKEKQMNSAQMRKAADGKSHSWNLR